MFEILVSHPVFTEVSDELSEFGVRNGLFTYESGKVNLLQNTGKNRIILGNSAQRLVQRVANIQVGGFVN